jgi:hypothetical protein
MSDEGWIFALRLAGGFHFATVALAHFTPIPPRWDQNLAQLPHVHRRFAVAQNVFIGAVMVFLGAVSLAFAPELVDGSTMARVLCAGAALWWGGRLLVLPWLGVWPELQSRVLRAGFVMLHAECALFALAYGWLALR